MNCKQAKEIPIVEYLIKIGHKPSFRKNHNIWFTSPFREEAKPSFKVDTNINCWYDHGLGKGGNIIDLAKILFNTNNITEVLKNITSMNISNIFSFHQQKQNCSKLEIISVKPLINSVLINYLKSRKISLETASEYCSEIIYSNNGNKFYAIGFKNNKGGYELRSKTFKGSSSPKWITSIANNSKECSIFEGFLDFLSFKELSKEKQFKQDAIILNSISNLDKAIPLMRRYNKLYLYLDNDSPGKKTTTIIMNLFTTAIDRSKYYKEHNDLNEYLSSKIATPER